MRSPSSDISSHGYGVLVAIAFDGPEAVAAASVELIVDVLKELSDGGPALELGVGTGRVALELAAAGVQVTGIDSSLDVLDALRARPGGEELPVLLGNFRDLEGGPYSLIYALRDVFFRLRHQDDQVACFANASQAMSEGGILLLETSMPRFGFGEGARLSVEEIDDRRVVLRIAEYDAVQQAVSSATMTFAEGRIDLAHDHLRHALPAELDLMARIAGLTLKARWGDWYGRSPSPGSPRVVSLYQLRTQDW